LVNKRASCIGAIAVAVIAPAVLLLGAGTASASIGVNATSAPGGVDVWIASWGDGNGPAPSGWCTYTSTVDGDPAGKPLPAINVPFYMAPDNAGNGKSRLWFPSYPTGATWDITVNCPGSAPQFTQVVW
jgi:hypothetical protein